MAGVPIAVHEVLDPFGRFWTRYPPVPQVFDKSRVMRGQPAELGPRHICIAQKAFDLTQKQRQSPE
jgi:hypothetical protein